MPMASLVVFPITEERYRIIADMGKIQGDVRRTDPTLEEVQAILDRRGPVMRASDPIGLLCIHINERKVADYRAGKSLPCRRRGTHTQSSRGMNTGMQDACNLAWKLALVCHGLCKEKLLLDSYSMERSAVGDKVVKRPERPRQLAILRGGVRTSHPQPRSLTCAWAQHPCERWRRTSPPNS